MSAYLINHLRIPGGIPNDEGLSYLEQVEATAKAYQTILHLRVNNAVSDLVLVDGVGADFTVAGFARDIRLAKAAAAHEESPIRKYDGQPAVDGTC